MIWTSKKEFNLQHFQNFLGNTEEQKIWKPWYYKNLRRRVTHIYMIVSDSQAKNKIGKNSQGPQTIRQNSSSGVRMVVESYCLRWPESGFYCPCKCIVRSTLTVVRWKAGDAITFPAYISCWNKILVINTWKLQENYPLWPGLCTEKTIDFPETYSWAWSHAAWGLKL